MFGNYQFAQFDNHQSNAGYTHTFASGEGSPGLNRNRNGLGQPSNVTTPKLSALELFQGLDSHEILYLEHNILYYLREALRTFILEAKQQHHLSEFIQRLTKQSFKNYVFKSDETHRYGQEVHTISHQYRYDETCTPFESPAMH